MIHYFIKKRIVKTVSKLLRYYIKLDHVMQNKNEEQKCQKK